MNDEVEQGRVFFARGDNKYAFNEKEQFALNEDKDILYKHYRYDSEKMQSAYCPIMGWIRDIYVKRLSKKMSVTEFVEKSNVYFPQRECIITYIESFKSIRWEYLIIGEAFYERDRFIESIINMIKFLSKKIKMFFILDGFQFSNGSVVNLIKKITEVKINNFCLFIYYNEDYKVNDYFKTEFSFLLKNIEYKGMLIDYCVADFKHKVISTVPKDFVFIEEECHNYLLELNNMLAMLAFNQDRKSVV